MREGAAGSALQVFSFLPSFERVTGKDLSIHDLTTFSSAHRAEKSSECPAEHRIFGLAGSGPGISACHLFSLDLSSAPALQAQPRLPKLAFDNAVGSTGHGKHI